MQLGTTVKQYKVLMYMNLRKNQNRTRSFSFNPDENVNICDPTPSIANESMMAGGRVPGHFIYEGLIFF